VRLVLIGLGIGLLIGLPLALMSRSADDPSPFLPSHAPASNMHTGTQTPTDELAWEVDPRCSIDQMLVAEVKWMDQGIIPDTASNESSEYVLAAIDDATAEGGTCDDVLRRLQQALG
jgi:hypothetical protein